MDGSPLKNYGGPVTWVGDSCQYQDISIQFHIVLWISVVLIIVTWYSFVNQDCCNDDYQLKIHQ
jgi:hypothetical protein